MEQIGIDVNELQKKIIELGYADTHHRAQLAAPYVCDGDHAGLAVILRHAGTGSSNSLVMMANVRDAETLIKWHKNNQPSSDGEPWQAAEAKAAYDKIASKSGLDHEAFKPGALLREIEGLLNTPVATPWEKGEADELEQVWRILMGYDEEHMQAPPRQRGSVVIAARDLLRQSALKEGLKEDVRSMAAAMNCAPVELAEAVQKMAGEREGVRSVFGVSADASLFDAARKFKAYSDKAHKAILGRNIHISDLPELVSTLCKDVQSNDRGTILDRLKLIKAMVEQLGGWDDAYENLRKLDKAAEDLVNTRTIIEDRDAWRRIALKLAE